MNFSSAGSLRALLSTLTDPRDPHGLRHPMNAMLAATVCGILTGARGCNAISQWVQFPPGNESLEPVVTVEAEE